MGLRSGGLSASSPVGLFLEVSILKKQKVSQYKEAGGGWGVGGGWVGSSFYQLTFIFILLLSLHGFIA